MTYGFLPVLALVIVVTGQGAARDVPDLDNLVAGPREAVEPLRDGVADPRAIEVPAALLQAVRDDPEANIQELVDFLVEGEDDEFVNARRIHDWIALNIAYNIDALTSFDRRDTSYQATLRAGKAACAGYSRLFIEMCRRADIHAVSVSGQSRGMDFRSAYAQFDDDSGHAWNAVELGGGWYLVDVTWDAGRVSNLEWSPRYRTDFLFLDPGVFVYSHQPSDPRWQLMAESLSASEFEDLPFLYPGFFDRGMDFEDGIRGTQSATNRTSLTLEIPAETELMTSLETVEGRTLEGRTLTRWSGDSVTVEVRFPESGEYNVALFARDPGEEYYGLVGLVGYSAKVLKKQDLFPVTTGSYVEHRSGLVRPVRWPPPGKKVPFEIRVPGAAKVAVVIGEDSPRWVRLKEKKPGVFSGRARIDRDVPVTLCARFEDGHGPWNVLVSFGEL